MNWANTICLTLASVTVSSPTSMYGQMWSKTDAPSTNWSGIASSADGNHLVAAVRGGVIYTSTNSGTTWVETNALTNDWRSVASSVDGRHLFAITRAYTVYESVDSGQSWRQASEVTYHHGGNGGPGSVACSADGNKVFASDFSIACSAGGTKLVNAVYTGNLDPGGPTFWIYSSTNSGNAWTNTSAPVAGWSAVASSANGTRLVAASGAPLGGPYIRPTYISTNSGTTWTITSTPLAAWTSIASSADGTRLVAAASQIGPLGIGAIYVSTDAGVTWNRAEVPTNNWSSVATSADGTKLVAVADGGGIYSLQSVATPLLQLGFSNDQVLLSWIVPSVKFVLKQNSDLGTTNWIRVAEAPTLNYSNLQYQVGLQRPSAATFYQLFSQ